MGKSPYSSHMNVPIHRRFDAGMTEQLLQHTSAASAFDCTRCIGVSQSVHTKCLILLHRRAYINRNCSFAGSPVRQLIKTRSRAQARSFSRAPIHVFQRGVEQFRFLCGSGNLRIELFQDVVSMASVSGWCDSSAAFWEDLRATPSVYAETPVSYLP